MDGRVKPGNDDLSRPGINEPTGNAKRNKKNRQFLAKPAGSWYCFSEIIDKLGSRFSRAALRRSKAGNRLGNGAASH
jgi:hypothetical protein